MSYNREVGRVKAWDGERGVILRGALLPHESRELAFALADVIEGSPAVGDRCTYTPGRDDRALHVRAKGAPC